MNCQELAAQQPLRPINWCSRLLKMTSMPSPCASWITAR
ncbi:hypothetical protein AB11_5036, partial [Escherichia coli 1-176-05_S1_C1]